MNDEQINLAISREVWYANLALRALLGYEIDHCESKIKIKNYCTNLRSMREAEKLMDQEHWQDYIKCFGGSWEEVMRSSARQRAEAFLRTLGKWNDQSGDATKMEVQK